MSGHWLYTLTVGPLGFYLWVIAVWHSDRHPRVVSGLLDFGLLALGIGGLLVFGPFGQFLAQRLFGHPDGSDWVALASGLGLVGCWLARRALHRFVVYHVSRDQVVEAVAEGLVTLEGPPFVRTLTGFERVDQGRRITVDFVPLLRSAQVEAHGPHAEALIQALRGEVRRRLGQVEVGASPVALPLYALSLVVMIVPMLVMLVNQPRARETLRTLLERLTGG